MTSLEERVADEIVKTACVDISRCADLPKDYEDLYRRVARAAIAVCAEEMARRIEEGFDRPVDKPYRTDGIPSKNDQCPHGAYMYESCDACCAAAIRCMGERGE